ncbi:MAG: hypothetical protein JW874_14470 [Spirochaetales bacterium]|nr:hypothetical protein [Spirochaetales bacterium]
MKKIVLLSFLAISTVMLSAADLPVVTVLDFTSENVSESEMRTIISLISSAMFRSGEYTVIDISQRETILEELEFSLSGCTDESCAMEIGKLLSAEMIVTGSIGLLGSKIVISAKLLETETGKTLGAADGTYTNLDKFVSDVDKFVGRFKQDLGFNRKKFPVMETVGLGVAVAAIGAGVVLLALGLPDYLAYTDARDAYENADSGDDLTALYDAMTEAWNTASESNAEGKTMTGIILAGTGVAVSTVFTILLVSKIKKNKKIDIGPASEGIGISVGIE